VVVLCYLYVNSGVMTGATEGLSTGSANKSDWYAGAREKSSIGMVVLGLRG